MSQRAIITENSGNGPTYHVTFLGGLKEPEEGHEWVFTVDGGPLQAGAVLIAGQVPKT